MQPQHPSKTQQPIKVIGKHKFYDIRQADQILRTRYMVAEIQEIFIRSGVSQGFMEGIAQLLHLLKAGIQLQHCDTAAKTKAE